MSDSAASAASVLAVRREGACLALRLDRPQRGNALSPPLVAGLQDQIDAAAGLSVLSLSGGGEDFCTGFDLGDVESVGDAELLSRFVRIELLLQSIVTLPAVTLAYAHGRAWGAGADLFCAFGERWADPAASFRFPGPQFGLVLGTRRLAQRVGAPVARRVLMAGEVLDAPAALACGLVDRLGPRSEFESRVRELEGAPVPDPVTREALLRRIDGGDLDGNLDGDLAALVRSAARPGLRERILAYRARVRAEGGSGGR